MASLLAQIVYVLKYTEKIYYKTPIVQLLQLLLTAAAIAAVMYWVKDENML